GKVVRIADFGAFVEILPGKKGLVYISELEPRRVEKVEDVCRLGDEIITKVIGIDEKGKIRLSRKQAIDPSLESEGEGNDGPRRERPSRDRDRDRDRGDRRGGRGDRDRGDRRGGRGERSNGVIAPAASANDAPDAPQAAPAPQAENVAS